MATRGPSPPALPVATLADAISVICSSQLLQQNLIDLRTVKALRCVSKQVKDAANPLLCKIKVSPSALGHLSPAFTPNIKVLKLFPKSRRNFLTKDHLLQLYATLRHSNLESLEITGACPDLLQALPHCPDWPKLKVLSVLIEQGPPSMLFKSDLDAFKDYIWPLESLTIISTTAPGTAISMALQSMLSFLPGLKQLKLSHVTIEEAKAIVNAGLDSLERLDLSTCVAPTSGNVPTILSTANFPKLTYFALKYGSYDCVTLTELTSAPWIKNLSALVLTNDTIIDGVIGIPSAAARSLLRTVNKAQNLSYIHLKMGIDDVAAFKNLSLPSLTRLTLELTSSGRVGEIKPIDNALNGLFQANMPKLTQLFFCFGSEMVYKWRNPPAVGADAAKIFPACQWLKIFHTGRNTRQIWVSPEIIQFLGTFVSKRLVELHLRDIHCYPGGQAPHYPHFQFGRVTDVLGVLLEGVSETQGCSLRNLTAPIGDDTIKNLPIQLRKLNNLEMAVLSSYYDGTPEGFSREKHSMRLEGSVNIGSKPKFVFNLELSGIHKFWAVAEYFDAEVVKQKYLGEEFSGEEELNIKLAERYPDALYKY